MDIDIRKAVPEDGTILADLMNIAGDGIPAYLWASMAEQDEDVMEVGARRVASTEGGFSYSNVHVAVASGEITGMLLGYRLPETHEAGQLEECPTVVRPLMELECLIPGSWYINAVAVVSRYRGQGVGTHLMQLAQEMAGKSGAGTVALVVAEDNRLARTLYLKLGYEIVARRPIVRFPACPHTGDYVLMTKRLSKFSA